MEGLDPDQLFATDTEKTFQYDEGLPSLPVPSLKHTLDRYLDSVKPHVTDTEFRQTEFIVQQFASGVGKDLHQQLVQKGASSRNWLSQWWTDYAYLDFRLPIAPFVNFAGPGPYINHFLPPQEGTQIERAALIMHISCKYWKMIRQERLRPDKDSKGQNFSMSQYRNAYSTCRIPAVKRDHLKYYFKTESEGPTPLNLTVFCRGRIFSMRGVDENEVPLTPPELQKQFQYIRDKCDSLPMGPGVGALTGDNRESWAQMRSRLLALHPRNYHTLEEIQKSMMGVILDDDSPTDETDLFRHGLAGDSTNRWFDKSITHIFYKNGLTASNCDHSPMDAMVLVTSTYYADVCVKTSKGKWQGSVDVRPLETPRELEFVLDDVIYRGIDNAKQVYNAYASNLQCCVHKVDDCGKKYLRKHKLHPDTHVQLALQYAYYRTYKRPASTYETGTTRKFYNARTETVRSCTVEAIDWSKAMLDKNTTLETKFHQYKKAMNKQNLLMAEATQNEGCDRHLMGLQILAIESGLPMPQLYTDPAYVKSGGGGNFVLSTSFCGYTTVFGGVVPMCENGYGCFYKIEPNSITIFGTSWASCAETDATKFNNTIHTCLREMRTIIDTVTATSSRL